MRTLCNTRGVILDTGASHMEHYPPLVGIALIITHDKKKLPFFNECASLWLMERFFVLNRCWPCQLHYRAVQSPCQRTSRWSGCPESGKRWLRTEPRRGSPPRGPGPAPRSAHSPSPGHLWQGWKQTSEAQTGKDKSSPYIFPGCVSKFWSANPPLH